MRILVTGGAGFIGLALVRRLLDFVEPSDEVIILDSLERHGQRAELDRVMSHSCVRLVQADLTSDESLGELAFKVDRLYHMAARIGVGPVMASPAQTLRTNTLTTLNILDWFADHANPGARFLFASTSEVYSGNFLSGSAVPIPTPEDVPVIISDLDNARFSYALAKIWGEAYAKYIGSESDCLFVSVRYHNVYGPDMGNDHVIPQIINRVKEHEDPFRIIGAEQTRSFCWIEDAVEATYRIMESEQLTTNSTVHIGNQCEVEIGHLYDMIFQLCQWAPVNRISQPAPAGSVSRRCPNIAKLRLLTQFEPLMSLEEGLRKTVSWYLED